MPATSGFHSEWVTLGLHRVLIQKRAGFPDDGLRFTARLAVEICDQWIEGPAFEGELGLVPAERPRVVSVYQDDTEADVVEITIAGVEVEAIRGLDRRVEDVFAAIYTRPRYACRLEIVRQGEVAHPGYNLMEHLSVEAGVAADRFVHRDSAPPP